MFRQRLPRLSRDHLPSIGIIQTPLDPLKIFEESPTAFIVQCILSNKGSNFGNAKETLCKSFPKELSILFPIRLQFVVGEIHQSDYQDRNVTKDTPLGTLLPSRWLCKQGPPAYSLDIKSIHLLKPTTLAKSIPTFIQSDRFITGREEVDVI